MLYCEKCKVKIRTRHSRCPLCHGPLTGEGEEAEQVFPVVPKENTKYNLLHQVINFAAIFAAIVSIALNWIISPQYKWSWYVVAAVTCSWVVLKVGILKRKNLMKNTVWQLIIIQVILFLWDFTTGWERWSINYFLPIGILLALIVMIFLTMIQRLTSPEYMIYFLVVCMIGCLPVILLLLHQITIAIPSIICGGVCLILLSAFLVFQKNAVISEVSKKFHI